MFYVRLGKRQENLRGKPLAFSKKIKLFTNTLLNIVTQSYTKYYMNVQITKIIVIINNYHNSQLYLNP
jgi:hypothetical protein